MSVDGLRTVRDSAIAPTWFSIFFYGSLSEVDARILNRKGTADLLEELKHGNCASDTMLTTNRQSVDNFRQAATFRQKELFADMLIHILLHERHHGQCPAE